jgi:hypothetical protein
LEILPPQFANRHDAGCSGAGVSGLRGQQMNHTRRRGGLFHAL